MVSIERRVVKTQEWRRERGSSQTTEMVKRKAGTESGERPWRRRRRRKQQQQQQQHTMLQKYHKNSFGTETLGCWIASDQEVAKGRIVCCLQRGPGKMDS
jgi:hypothetical protein